MWHLNPDNNNEGCLLYRLQNIGSSSFYGQVKLLPSFVLWFAINQDFPIQRATTLASGQIQKPSGCIGLFQQATTHLKEIVKSLVLC